MMTFELVDKSTKDNGRTVKASDGRRIKVRVECNNGVLEIYPEGYGEATMENGFGPPVNLELYEGRLRLLVFSDINSEEVKVIDLEGAKESLRP